MEVQARVDGEEGAAERQLRSVLEELSAGCARYISVTKGAGSGPGIGKTKLDKERMKLCQRDVVSLRTHEVMIIVILINTNYLDRAYFALLQLQIIDFGILEIYTAQCLLFAYI